VKKVIFTALSAMLLLGAMSCSQPAYGQELRSDKEWNSNPDVSATELAELVEGNTEFALALYQQLKEEDGNIFFSPYSLSVALAMTYAGAEGESKQQMKDTLHFLLEDEALHAAFNKMALEIASRGQESEDFSLNIANAIWGQQDYDFLPAYLDLLAENYDAGMRLVNFIDETEAARVAINNWVSQQTEGKIEDLLQKGIISGDTRLVLTNAMYFNAAWHYPFDEDNTDDALFHLLDGSDVTVQMMHQTEGFAYTEGEGYKAVELMYEGDEMSMVILLPDAGSFAGFEVALDADTLSGIISDMQAANVTLSLPKFEYDSEFSISDALKAMGMPVAFSAGADFSGMTGNQDLFIKDVVHKAFVSANEAGTEAAAASAVIMDLKAAPGENVEFNADHPFIFAIRDVQTGSIIFIGRVMNPEA